MLLVFLALVPPNLASAASPASSSSRPAGKVLEELHYRVDVWIWRDALKTKIIFQEVAPGRYRADLTGQTQGFLSVITGNWRGAASTEMEYSQGKLQPLLYREIASKGGKEQVLEFRFDYARNIVELWKSGKDNTMTKRWETTLQGPIYDPLTFFYNSRMTGNSLEQRGGDTIKFQGIPYPKPEEFSLRVGSNTPQGRRIMLELGNLVFRGERNVVFAYLDSDGMPTKVWTKVLKFSNIDIELLPGGKRLNKEEITGALDQAREVRPATPSRNTVGGELEK